MKMISVYREVMNLHYRTEILCTRLEQNLLPLDTPVGSLSKLREIDSSQDFEKVWTLVTDTHCLIENLEEIFYNCYPYYFQDRSS